mgnify:CR=1 FL=1
MRAPLSWLRDFTPLPDDVDAITDALNQLGLEVEGVEQPGAEINGVVVARVLEVHPHPDADKLRLVDVEYGVGETRVVCGAPNVAAGMLVPYAGAGATLPGGFTLEPRKIRGVVSDGMLCSTRELDLGDDHGGIMDLDATLEPGTDICEALGLDDAVFELSITPNRPDAMSIVGIARDLAAHFGLPFTVPGADRVGAGDGLVPVEVVDAPGCPRFTARALAVTLGPSPEWMQRRLTLAGMRPISNVVDVTNYVLLERGQPLHAFDRHRLPGGGLRIRRAAEGETIETLDGITRTLTAADLLVCGADDVPQAVAGIMGGAAAEVGEDTTEIVLEAAYFDPMTISRTSKRLGLRSESSARFERGIDPNAVLAGSDRAVELLVEHAAARVLTDVVDAYPAAIAAPRVTVRTARVNHVLGTSISTEQVTALLAPLGITCEADGADAITAVVPTFRPDIEREIDLIEEIARRLGLDAIPRTLPSNPDHVGGLTAAQAQRRLVADALVGTGCSEAYTLSLLAEPLVAPFGYALGDTVTLTNPLRAEESVLRPAILPGLLGAVAFNAAQGNADVALFETGHVFRRPTGGSVQPDERDHVAVAIAGTRRGRPHDADRPVDVYDAIRAVDALVDALRLADAIRAVKDGLTFCRQCRNIAEGELCEFCLDPKRDRTKILVVEEPSTIYAIERAAGYRGLYHVLLGALSPLDGVGPGDIRAEELVERVKAGGIDEVILATNPTIEGEATAIYLTRLLKPFGVRVSRIAYGIPVGMDIDYADEVTLLKSIEGRRDL